MIYQYNGVEDKCPLPLVKMRVILNKMKKDDICIMQISDKGSLTDIPNYLTQKGYHFSQQQLSNSVIELHIKQVS
ncbi:sulfurtransferase TusA family protein [Thalassotalea piscium]|nr:sulfurtransferase TusA family protein [Thalassotalea piscium]